MGGGIALMELGLDGKGVLVAGSSRGIGLAIARGFVREGSRVAITGRDEHALAAAAAELGAVQAIAGDMSDEAHVADVVARLEKRWRGIDVAVLNIGSGSAALGFDEAVDVNLRASARAAEAVLPGMLERGGGALVFIASIAGVESIGAPRGYEAAKSALLSYAKGLARAHGPAGVRVNSIAPGNVLFPGGGWAEKVEQELDRWNDYVRANVPLGRFGTPDEIADAAVFLASERASFVTGACLLVDGGQTRTIA